MSNKYQEALDRQKENVKKLRDKEFFEYGDDFRLLQKLVDKETPMKVKIFGHDEDWLTGLKIAVGECPKCKFHVCDDEFYCRNCGQRIYFEESDD